jgi:hypothetical protein
MEVSDPQKIMTETFPKSVVLMVHLRCHDVIIGSEIMQILKLSNHYMYQILQTTECGLEK